jgi:3-oxoacyl-[acyl-carrier protein] reductase
VETHLRGRTALVTAASKGLGFAVARALATEGCRVVMSSSKSDSLDAAVAQLAAEGFDVVGHKADLSVSAECDTLVDWTAERFGGIDVLINNTRGPRLGLVHELSDDDWMGAFDLVFMSALRVTRRALPHLRSRHGAVVNLTSIAAHQPVDGLVLSNVLRPGVVGLGKTLAKEAAPDVRVNSILTGRFLTDRIVEENKYRATQLGVSEDEVAKRTTASIPLGRYGRPDELAAAAVFLASDCATFITGATLSVDGGEHQYLF